MLANSSSPSKHQLTFFTFGEAQAGQSLKLDQLGIKSSCDELRVCPKPGCLGVPNQAEDDRHWPGFIRPDSTKP